MRIGCCLDLTKDARQGFAQAKQLLAAGFDFLEANLTSLATIPQEEYEALKAAVNALGLPVPACNCMLPKEIRMRSSPGVDEAALHEYVERAFSLARRASAWKRLCWAAINPVSFLRKRIRMRPTMNSSPWCVSMWFPPVKNTESPVVIEPLRVPCNFINTLADGMRVVRGVDHPQVRLLAGITHPCDDLPGKYCLRAGIHALYPACARFRLGTGAA